MRFGNILGVVALGSVLAFGSGAEDIAAAAVSQADFPPAPPPYEGHLRHKPVCHKVIRHKEAHHRRAAERKPIARHKSAHAGKPHHKVTRHKAERKRTMRHEHHRSAELRRKTAPHKVYERRYHRQFAERELRAPQVVAPYRKQTDLAGSWQVISINSKPAVTGMRGILPNVNFSGGRINGQSGCSDFSGSFAGAGAQVQFAPVSAGQTFCPKPLMKQEQALFEALGAARSYRFVSRLHDQFPGQRITGGVIVVRELQFLDGSGQISAVLVREIPFSWCN